MHLPENPGASPLQPISGKEGYAPYSDYKDSGIEWLGEIPAHWEAKRLKKLVTEPLKYGANEPANCSDPNFPRYIRITDIHENGMLKDDSFRSIPPHLAQPYLLVTGDLLFARSGSIGKTFQYHPSWGEAAYAGYLIRARFGQNSEPSFMEYFTQSHAYNGWLLGNCIQTTIQNVSAERYANLQIPVPPHSEQLAIVTFLDRETEKIDTLIEKQEQLIDLLKERRIALISHAVTKGLNPDVPMKDSGIEWLGEIPAHWEVKQLGQIGTFRKCNGGTKEDESPEGIPCVRYGDIYTHHDFFVRQCCSYISPESAINYTPIQYGDILFAGSGETLDEIAKSAVNLIDAEVYCGGDVILLRASIERDTHFMGYAVGAPQAAYQKALMGRGITVMHIYGSQLKHLSVALPPIEEQQAIAVFLERETAKIDTLISKIHQAIELQKESRSALITAAVTGKIDVRQESISTTA